MDFTKCADKDGMLILSDGKGGKAAFDFLEMAVVDGNEYAALLQEGDNEVILLAMNENKNGKEVYSTIEDDDLFEKVTAAFEALFEED